MISIKMFSTTSKSATLGTYTTSLQGGNRVQSGYVNIVTRLRLSELLWCNWPFEFNSIFQLHSWPSQYVWMTQQWSLKSGIQLARSAITAWHPCTIVVHRQPLLFLTSLSRYVANKKLECYKLCNYNKLILPDNPHTHFNQLWNYVLAWWKNDLTEWHISSVIVKVLSPCLCVPCGCYVFIDFL